MDSNIAEISERERDGAVDGERWLARGLPMNLRMTAGALRLSAYSGFVMTAVFFVGWIFFARFGLGHSPSLTAEQVAALYTDHEFSMRLGQVLMLIAASLMALWAPGLMIWTRRAEAGHPILTYAQLVCVSGAVIDFVLCMVFWGVASFRPGEVSAEITLTLNDIGWFLFLFTAPLFMLWAISFGLAILWSPGKHQAYPRWAGYYALLVAFMEAPATLVIFFKTGPFAYNGLIALWLVLADFFVWVIVMSVLTLKVIGKEEAKQVASHNESVPIPSF
jgi:hypothetical protein